MTITAESQRVSAATQRQTNTNRTGCSAKRKRQDRPRGNASSTRLILYLRFVEGRTLAEIGAEIGVTQMQVSRLLNGILTRMRERALDADSASGLAPGMAS